MPRNVFLIASLGLLALYWTGQLYAALFAASSYFMDRQALPVLLLAAFLLFNALVLRSLTDRRPEPWFWRCWWGTAIVWMLTLIPFSHMLTVESVQ